MNKRGNIIDIITISVIIFGVALAGLILLTVSDSLYPHLLNTTLADNPTANSTMIKARDFAEGRVDYMVSGMIIILLIGLLVFAYLSTASPIFTALYIVLLIIAGVLAGIFQWAWERITASASLASGLANMPITNFIMSNFVLFIIGIGIISMVLMYVGYSAGGGYNG